MKNMKYILLCLSLIGIASFLLFRYSADIGICPNVITYEDGGKYCQSTRGLGDYLWPLWDFSRALLLVGIMTFIRPTLSLRFVILTGIFALATLIGVLLAPSVSSDFLVPVEKKIVGTLLSGLYLLVAVIMFLWSLLRISKGK